MMRKVCAALAAFIAFTAGPAMACSFNTDCNVGSTCMKQRSSMEGVCVGGMSPGRPDDSRQSRAPTAWQNQQSHGGQCSFSTDCGAGSMCLKEAGRIYGVCVSRR